MVISGACGIGSQEFVESAIGERDIEKRRVCLSRAIIFVVFACFVDGTEYG